MANWAVAIPPDVLKSRYQTGNNDIYYYSKLWLPLPLYGQLGHGYTTWCAQI